MHNIKYSIRHHTVCYVLPESIQPFLQIIDATVDGVGTFVVKYITAI
jgi:hypothetical protein